MARTSPEHRRKERAAQAEHEAAQAEFEQEYERTHGRGYANKGGPPANKAAAGPPENKSTAQAREQLEAMSREELYQLAQDRDVQGRSSMSKAELVEALLG